MNQIVIKDNIYHIRIIDRTRADGGGYQNHRNIITSNKIVRKLDKYLSKVRIFFFQKEDKNKRLTTVVPATRSARAIDGGEDGDGT